MVLARLAVHVFARRRAGESSRAGDENNPSDSELSSPPSSDSESDRKTVGRKRKRDEHTPAAATIKRESKEILVTEITSPKKTNGKTKRARRAPAEKVVAANGSVKVEPPPNWEEGADPCVDKWEGIECNGSRVTSL